MPGSLLQMEIGTDTCCLSQMRHQTRLLWMFACCSMHHAQEMQHVFDHYFAVLEAHPRHADAMLDMACECSNSAIGHINCCEHMMQGYRGRRLKSYLLCALLNIHRLSRHRYRGWLLQCQRKPLNDMPSEQSNKIVCSTRHSA